MMRRLLLALAVLASTVVVTIAGPPPEPAAAATFGGWTYTPEVNASRFDGLALNQVSYNGVKVFERISLPVMNVYYDGNACGPYTDRLGGSYYEGPTTTEFTQDGVRWRSIELTDQIGAYVITMVYYLSENGDFDAHMFSKGLQCNIRHDHLPYWRMDVDLAGAADDEVWYQTDSGMARLTTEFSTRATTAVDHGWEIRDAVTGDRITIDFDDGTFALPGEVVPETQYVNNSVYGRQYRSSEQTWSGGARRNTLFGDEGEQMNDVVLWYSGYMPHAPEEGPDLWHSTGIRIRVNPSTATDATVAGDLTANGSGPVSGIQVDLFSQAADGSRDAYLDTQYSDAAGRFAFTTEPGCYTTVAIAPSGRSFVGGSQYAERSGCVTAGQTDDGFDAVLNASGSGSGFGGGVTYGDGTSASGVQVDLFATDGSGSRTAFLDYVATDGDGAYSFDTAPGCYTAVFIAPSGQVFTNGSPYAERYQCVTAGQFVGDVDTVLVGGADPARIGDQVTRGGSGVEGIQADLFTMAGDGSRASYVRSTSTDGAGAYGFDVGGGCYVVVFIAPSGQVFTNGSQYLERSTCVANGEQDLGLDAVLQ